MGSVGGKVLAAMVVPLILLAVIGMMTSCGGGSGGGCPVDPVTKKQICSRYSDHEAWSRATVSEMEREDK